LLEDCIPVIVAFFAHKSSLISSGATMPFASPFPELNIPKCNLLEYLFPKETTPSDTPLWIDSKDTDHYLTPQTLLQWTKRLALGLDRIGSKPGEVVMILTPNHIFVPVAYLGIVGSKRIFSGANPAYTVSGMFRSSRLFNWTL
jgi:4-coumarate--CoA ligase